jgi:transcriptional regulator with XRE-family HTH domain
VTDEWRRRVAIARKNANLSQEEVARKLGISQGAYSRIESGATASSNLVVQISSIVGVAGPTLHTDEMEQQWLELGQAMRAKSPRLFRRALALVEALANIDDHED